MSSILYLVIPCYNEEEALSTNGPILLNEMNKMISMKLIDVSSKILFVDDGSTDKTWERICRLRDDNPMVTGIKLTRNYGHQNALYAGLIEAGKYADVTISMDADLQDDVNCLKDFIKKYYEGCDIVYGVRKDRNVDSQFKQWTAKLYYKIANTLDPDIVYNHADFRLMSKKAVNSLSCFKEYHLFLRGIIPMLGYKSSVVEYDRKERYVGKSKYDLRKMCRLAWDGIYSTTAKPLKLLIWVGFVLFFMSFIGLVIQLYSSDLLVLIYVICMSTGLNIIALGIIGEYINRIFDEVKQRPRYIIEEALNKNLFQEKDLFADGCCRKNDGEN